MTDQVVDPGNPGSEVAAESSALSPAVDSAGPTDESARAESVVIEPVVPTAAPAETELAAESAAAPITTEPAVEAPIAPPARRQRAAGPLRFIFGFTFGLLAIFALSAGGLYAFELQYSGRILPGIHVGTVDVSGLTASQATARLADAYASLTEGELVLVAGALSARTPLADLGRRADIESMVASALAVGRDGSPFDRIVGNAKTAARGVVLDPQVIFDAEAVKRAVVSFVAAVDRTPIDARVEVGADAFVLVPATDGRSTDVRGLLSRTLDAVRPLELDARVVVQADVTSIVPTLTTNEVTTALEAGNRMIADIVVADILQSWTIPAAQVRTWVSFEFSQEGGYQPVAVPTGLEAQLADMAQQIQRPPANASYLIDKTGKIVGASEGKEGRALDAPGTVAAISALLAQRATGATGDSVAPAVTIVKPELTTEMAAATAPLMRKLSEWTTYFPISERNGFGANIWIPAMDIDGYVVAPGAWFDFWKAIGPVTRARGYLDGGAIINGKTEPQGALAGGICSTSTTLFNAALQAGLEMGARRNHYYYINRYPIGLDATVFQSSSGSVQTMSFRNDTSAPILIRAYKIKKGTSGYVKFELYGVPTGRTVTISPEIVKNIKPAIDTLQDTDTLPAGTTQRIETPVDGKDVWRTVTVTDASGAVIHQTTYYSHYSRVDGITLVGTGPSGTT